MEQKKEEHLSNYQDHLKKMTADEMIEFLQKEKEFWETVAIEEKYRLSGNNENIGEDTTREKTYHI